MKLEIVVFSDGKFGVRRTASWWELDSMLANRRISFASTLRPEGDERHYFTGKEYWERNCHFETLEEARDAMAEYGQPVSPLDIDYGNPIK